MKIKRGISLIILVITIIIMIIIAGATIVFVGDTITKATKARFYSEMNQISHQKELSVLEEFLDNKYGMVTEVPFLGRNITIDELNDFSSTLKAEIMYVRNSFEEKERLTTKHIWDKNMFEYKTSYEDVSVLSGLVNDIYYINSAAISTGEEYAYIYDSMSNVCFKVAKTTIGRYTVHSLEYAEFAIDGKNAFGVGVVFDETSVSIATDGTKAYEPDLNNFSYATEIVYYSPDFKEEYTVTADIYIQQGKPSTQTVNGKKYTFANYTSDTSRVWANIKTVANGLEGYWVWIPRFAYKLDSTNKKTDVIFIDINNKPLDTIKYGQELPEGYTVHEGFKQKDGLKGIWFSKYNPKSVETVVTDNTEPKSPDLTNFNTDEVTLVYYTADGKNSIERGYTSNPAQTVTEGETTYYWYNYTNKIWANIKTTSNDLEAYWVWIPRFAYKLESGTTKVILIDTNDRPIDTATYGSTLPNGYTVHEGFKQKAGIEGIWFSKYNPKAVETVAIDSTEPESPDLTNFNTDEVMLVYYTADGKNSIEREYTANPAQTITEGETTYYWYNYTNKIWANIKTVSNGLRAYWVWIPRFAYKIESGDIKVILIDENNKPIDTQTYGSTLPEGYTVHEGFKQKDGLKGIWFSKYNPKAVETVSE